MKSKTPSVKVLCSQTVQVSKLQEKGTERQAEEALLEEISRSGATVSLQCPIRQGATVSIDCRTCEFRGKVAGCTAVGDDYIAEIDFAEDSAWLPANFRPDGLFNPQSMVCERPGCTPDCTGDCGGGSGTSD